MAKSKSEAGNGAAQGRTKAPRANVGVRTHGQSGALHAGKRALAGASARAHGSNGDGNGAGHGSRTWMEEFLPRHMVQELVHDAKVLLVNAKGVAKQLVRAGLDPATVKELPQRIALVADAEKAWKKQVDRLTPHALRDAREEAAQLKTDLMAAGRYVLRRDAEAQKDLDKIAAGEGLADLVRDLRDLAKFYTKRANDLKTADVPRNAIGRAKELAAHLSVAVATGSLDEKAREVHQHRVKALTMLDDATREIRAAGRYVFRTAPARLALFRDDFNREHNKRG